MKESLNPLIVTIPEVTNRESALKWLAKQPDSVKKVTEIADNGTILQKPFVDREAYVDDSARLYGPIILGKGCYVGFMAVVRLDELDFPEPLVVGEYSNIQDGAVIHSNTQRIGRRVIIAHQAIVHGAVLEDDVSLYIQAVADGGGTVVGKGSFLHQGSYVGKGIRIPAGRYIEPGQKILTQEQANDLPPVPEQIQKLREHVLELNIGHVERYLKLREAKALLNG